MRRRAQARDSGTTRFGEKKNLHYLLELPNRACPRETGAEPREGDNVVLLDRATLDGFAQGDRNGACRGVAVLGDVTNYLVLAQTKPLRRAVYDTLVGLVQD